jgi:hypothetical protein
VVITPLDSLTIRIGKGGDNQGGTYSGGTRMAGGNTGESSTVISSNLAIVSLGGGGAVSRETTLYNSGSLIPRDVSGWTGGGGGKSMTAAASGGVGGSSYKGGDASIGGDSGGVWAGGGGGAGGAGEGGGIYGTSGGAGQTTFITGSAFCLGGGGGGGAGYRSVASRMENPGTATCGGGAGKNANSAYSNFGTSGTGGGGGGGHESAEGWGGRGGSGTVIIRFALATSNQITKNLNMACHSFSSATTPAQSRSAGYLGTPFTTDSGVTQFTFPDSADSTLYKDWGTSGPTGCGIDYFTVYMWGYIKSPSNSVTSSVHFATRSDDGVQLNIGGVNVVGHDTLRGLSQGYDTGTASVTMSPNSWHFVQIWVHENTGGAGIELNWQVNSNPNPDPSAWTPVPVTSISRSVPRSMNVTFPGTSSDLVSTSIKATIDTSTVVYGGPNDSSTVKTMGGTFKFTESGTAISGCESVASNNGSAQCDLGSLPSVGATKYYKIYFTPTDSLLSTDLQTNVFSNTSWTQTLLMGKMKNATLKIGQYIAFSGVSSYPLNVYADTPIYGAISRSIVDSGTANCELDASKFFLSASRVGSCSVAANAAGDASHYSETTTATIYWVQWSDAYATRVPSVPTEIVLQHQTQIIRHAYETLTVTSYTDTATVPNTITSARPGQTIRILGTGLVSTDTTSQATFTDNEYANRTDLTNDYIQVVVPDGAVTGPITVDTLKGTAIGPTLIITSP